MFRRLGYASNGMANHWCSRGNRTDTFGELQDARHAADYDPSRAITLSEA